jgi:hypothetical protein
MDAVSLPLLLDHGVCVVVLVVIYFWRVEPLLSGMNTKLAILIDRALMTQDTTENSQ